MMKDSAWAGGSRPCILIVADDAAVRRSLELRLRAAGFDVRAYAEARQALADPETRRAACLIADLVTPGVDGPDLLRMIRAAGWQGPAVLIGGFLTDERTAKALRESYAAVLDKPLADARLMETVNRLVAAAQP